MKTQYARKEDVKHDWYVINADDMVLGKLAVKVATYLRGKHKPIYTPSVDTGDFVVVVNAEKVKLTGRKLDNKVYHWHTGYPGGIMSETARERLESKPEEVIIAAVRGMLPKNRLGRAMFKKLKVYKGSEHPHAAQNPVEMS